MLKKIIVGLTAIFLLTCLASVSYAYSGIDEEGRIHIIGNLPTQLDITITFFENEELYNSPSINKKAGTSLKPQTVRAVLLVDGFFKVRTWLGDKWISPKGRIIYNLEQHKEELKIETNTPIYEFPNVYEKQYGELPPQTVVSFEKSAGGWFHITAPTGTAWIKPVISAPKEVEQTDISLSHLGSVSVMQYPNENAKLLEYFLTSENWMPYEKTKDGWYHIHASTGDGWIQISDNQIPEKIDEIKTVKKVSNLYDSAGRWIGYLAPQQVKAFEKLNNAYKIHTWLGDAWIYLY